MNTFSDRLQKAMVDAGLTQAELAMKVGVSQPAIWRLVAGKPTQHVSWLRLLMRWV
jgi:predicted transcriptional regulator